MLSGLSLSKVAPSVTATPLVYMWLGSRQPEDCMIADPMAWEKHTGCIHDGVTSRAAVSLCVSLSQAHSQRL